MIKEVIRTTAFKKDYKRELKTDGNLDSLLIPVVTALVSGAELEAKYRDHKLSGDWKPCRDCHLKPDLVLIYSFPDAETLRLERLGSHSELSL